MALSAGLSQSEPLTAPSICHITVQLLSPQHPTQSWFCQAIWTDPLFQGLSFQMFSKHRFSVSVCWNTVWTVWVWRFHLVCPDTGLLLPHTSSRTMVLLGGLREILQKCWVAGKKYSVHCHTNQFNLIMQQDCCPLTHVKVCMRQCDELVLKIRGLGLLIMESFKFPSSSAD